MTTRREFLVLACGAASITAATTAKAQIDPNQQALRKAAMQDALRRVVGDAPVRRGRVKLQLPPLIDNGNSVPLSVATVVNAIRGFAATAGCRSTRKTSAPL